MNAGVARALRSCSAQASKNVPCPTKAIRAGSPTRGCGYGGASSGDGRRNTEAAGGTLAGYAARVPEWQERLTRDTHPTIRIEHELRYRLTAPLVRGAATWCDLGCGTGVAAAAALGDARAARVVLVDLEPDAAAQAVAELGAARAETLTADLSDETDLATLRELLLRADGGGVISCFEVVEHLRTFVPLLELLIDLAGEHDYTTVLSVPNDAFGTIENPYHLTMWGEGALEELRRMLPRDHVAAAQVPVSGSAFVIDGSAGDNSALTVAQRPSPVASHFIVAFGPRAAELRGVAAAEMTDLEGQRNWERQREANLAFHEEELAELRDYVHDLERRLDAGASGDDA